MSIGRALMSVGRSLTFGPFLFCLVIGGLTVTGVGCDGGANTGPNEVVKVDEAATVERGKMIHQMYDNKKGSSPSSAKK